MPTGTRLGNFEITGVVHRDSSGVIYAAEDSSLLGKVAIKEYLPAMLADRMANGKVGVRSLRYQQSFRDGKERFLSNARMLAALDEPALIRVLRCWKQHGTAYMAMPLYEGQTLNDVLRNSPKPGEAWLKSMLGPLLDAVTTLHKFDCYPCNVTPDNVVVLHDGTPLLFAFGAGRRAKASSTGDLSPDLNPGFAPIEQYADDPTMVEGPWTDVYSVAAVLYFAITGKPPPAPAARIVSDPLSLLRDAHAAYSALFLDAVNRGLAVLPGDRPQTIEAFRVALGIRKFASYASPMARSQPSPAASATAGGTTSVLPESRPVSPADVPEEEGTRAYVPPAASQLTLPPSPEPERASPLPSSGAVIGSATGKTPWKLVSQLIVVGLVALGILVWAVGEPRRTGSEIADRTLSMPPVATVAQPVPLIATSTAAADSPLPPVALSPAVADAAQDRHAAADAAVVATLAGNQTTPGPSVPLAPPTGKIRFSIKPWGEIIIDGKMRGASPPIKELSIPEGRHKIEIRNGSFPGHEIELEVRAGSTGSVSYSFTAP